MYKKASGEKKKSKTIGGSKTRKTIMACFLFCCVIIFSATVSSAVSNSIVPDTGQTLCYQTVSPYGVVACTGTGQDGVYSPAANQPLFTDNGDGTITDARTGLLWRKQDDGIKYNWYEASGTFDATYNASTVDVCGSIGAGWRLPTIEELNWIANYGLSNPAINTTYFPVTMFGAADGYWSGTESGLSASDAMTMHFDTGISRVDGSDKTEDNYVRCVNGAGLTSSFINNGTTTVSDDTMGLMWQKTDDNVQRTFATAISYCEGLTLAGYTDWRLPNIKELQSIVDYTLSNPAINKIDYFPGANSWPYWSSTTDNTFTDSAWSLDFLDGYVLSNVKTLGTLITRCVRDNVIDTTAPVTNIDSGPTQPVSNSTTATFTFHADETATFKCQMDAGGFTACTSPKTYTGLGAGDHTFYVKATDPVGNAELVPEDYSWTITLTYPDLVVTALTVPATGGAGAAASVTDTTQNSGLNTAVTSKTYFYLSTNATLDGADVLLGSGRSVPGLAAGASSTLTTSLTIPLGTSDGLYYIIAKADGAGVVTESDETNNKRTSTTRINIGPDLTVTALTGVPATSAVGGSINVSDTTKNNGSAVVATTTSFYLSLDNTLSGGDVLLGSRTVSALATGASEAAPIPTALTLPSGTAGTFYIIAKADGLDEITEMNEANNTKASTLIKIGGDLTVSAFTAPAKVTAGVAFNVTDTTKNSTLGSAVGASTTSFYLSTDTVWDGADILLGSRAVSSLGVGASSTPLAPGTSLTVPAGTAGTYYIIAKADSADAVTETNETNNTKASGLITIGGDLTVSALTVPATATIGLSFNVTDTTKNGTLGSSVGSSTTSFYLSKDTVLVICTSPGVPTGCDPLIGSRDILTTLAAGAFSTATTSLTVAGGTAPGTYYIIAKADGPDLIPETSETNNTKASTAIKIGGDLTVTVFTVPTTGAAGANVTVTYTAKNIGTNNIAASTMRFWLSTDAVPGGDTVFTNTSAVPLLAPGASFNGTASLKIPGGTLTGSYYIIAKADGTGSITGAGSIAEASETNNTKASLVIKIGEDLTVSALTGAATVVGGATYAVTDTTKNTGAGRVDVVSTTYFYLSTKSVLDGSETLLGSGRSVPALSAGGSDTATTTLTIPDVAPGAYYIIAVADGPGLITETTENNNIRAKALTVQ